MIFSYAKTMAKLAKKGARIAKEKGTLKQLGRMCETCACRSEQNKTLCYFIAADQAAGQLMSGGEFNCHTSDFKCADKPCVGFQLAKIAVQHEAEEVIKKMKA